MLSYRLFILFAVPLYFFCRPNWLQLEKTHPIPFPVELARHNLDPSISDYNL
jgi:hypothetical protein